MKGMHCRLGPGCWRGQSEAIPTVVVKNIKDFGGGLSQITDHAQRIRIVLKIPPSVWSDGPQLAAIGEHMAAFLPDKERGERAVARIKPARIGAESRHQQ